MWKRRPGFSSQLSHEKEETPEVARNREREPKERGEEEKLEVTIGNGRRKDRRNAPCELVGKRLQKGERLKKKDQKKPGVNLEAQ